MQILSEKIYESAYCPWREKRCDSTELLNNIKKPDPSHITLGLRQFNGVILYVKMLDGMTATVKVPRKVRKLFIRL